jgi:protein-S-isoprenylcysteine O-methyltransferase Ste14
MDRVREVSGIVGARLPSVQTEEASVRAGSARVAVAVAAIVVLGVLAVVASLWASVGNTQISAAGWAAMALGVLVALALGMGLMALVFFSSRHGYDDPDGDPR